MSNMLLFDGDLIVYRFAAEGTTNIDMGDGDVVTHFDLSLSLRNCKRYIEDLMEKFKARDYVICVSDRHNFRKQLAETYKAERKDKPKPKGLRPMREWLLDHPKMKLKPGLEADDLQGIISTNPKLYPQHRKIIVSIDKDMQQIPGWLYNPSKDRKPRLIDDLDADLFFLTQVLTGDPVDGYKGCPGIGPKKAARILQDAIDANGHLAGDVVSCCWPAVVATYESKGLTEADAIMQARMARILRHTDYDYKKKEPILWQPGTTTT